MDFHTLYIDWLRGTTAGGFRRSRYANTWKYFRPIFESELNIQETYSSGRNVWVWSDQHFGHKNIIHYSDRPFVNIQEMTETMIANHNDYVQPNDVCIWVGDVALMKDELANELLSQCHGYKILIIGNHDMQGKKLKKLNFNEIHLVKHVTIVEDLHEYDLVFSHYPMCNLPLPVFNIHGHEHITGQYTQTLQHINVNCELYGYKPINLKDIMGILRKRIGHF